MINPLKKYLYISLALHLVLIVVLLILTGSNNIKQPFVVFGAYSKKPSHTLYKVKNKIVPFTTGNIKTKFKSSTKHTVKHPNTNQKLVAKKTPNKKSVKPQNSNPVEKSKKNTQAIAKTERSVTINTKKQEALIEKRFREELKKMEIEALKEIENTNAKEKKLTQKLVKREPEVKPEPKPKPEKPEPAPEIPTTTEPEPNPEPERDKKPSTPEIENEPTEDTQEEFVFSLSGEIDKKFILYQKSLQQEVQRLWAPPLGVPKGTTCRIKFIIDKDGKVMNFENIKKSNVLIYDLSILRIAHLFKFDKCLWGKSFIIDFCQ